MSIRRIWAFGRHDLRILRRDPVYVVVLVIMPLLVMAFTKPLFADSLIASGEVGSNGAEQAVPGIAVLFALFLVSQAGWGVFREHGWGTWDRLRASWASPTEVLIGKSIVPVLQFAGQLAILFVCGGILLGLDVRGSVLALALVGLAFAFSLAAFAMVLVTSCRTVMQLNAVANMGAMAMAGLGGALTPLSSLPGWVEGLAHVIPSYWAMRGFTTVILDGGGLADVAGPVLALVGFTVVFTTIAVLRFDVDERKVSWA